MSKTNRVGMTVPALPLESREAVQKRRVVEANLRAEQEPAPFEHKTMHGTSQK